MIINGEEVELVTSFDQLLAGMIVWNVRPDVCACERHRFILVTPWLHGVALDDGRSNDIPAWALAPLPRCNRWTVLTPIGIGKRKFYRVVDPKLADASDAAERHGNAVTREAVRP